MSTNLNTPSVVALHNQNANRRTSELKQITQSFKSIKSLPNEVFDTRLKKRINLQITLYLRRPLNSKSYFHTVSTIDVSRYGALISSVLPLEIGTQIEVIRQKVLLTKNKDIAITTFLANAIVRHIRIDTQTNKYLIGLDFQQMYGKWLVI
jgi:hypothetical protein